MYLLEDDKAAGAGEMEVAGEDGGSMLSGEE
jgi:hypothetical protein